MDFSSLSLVEVAALVLEELKESVFCEPLAAGPLEVRARRVAGIFACCVALFLVKD